ncbi:MAG: hypothetical protein FWG61_00365 [Firmicutes bacterium]|nr:hypothetical protein [Bacillota bacterium]
MWNNRAWFIFIRIRICGMNKKGEQKLKGKQSRNLFLPLSLCSPHQWLLAFEGLVACIPGEIGKRARLALEIIHSMLLQLINASPQTIADVDIRDKNHRIRVIVRTISLLGGEKA